MVGRTRASDGANARLLPGSYFHRMMMHERQYVLSLEVDRLVCHLRKNAGIASRGKAYGGWERGGNLTYAHYLSSMALMPRNNQSKLHPDPHPHFVMNAKYIVSTASNADGHMDLYVTPVDQLIEMTR